MKKLSILFAILFVVSMAGLAVAHTISYDPNDVMSQMTVPVHNSEASTTLDPGDVVVWNVGASTSDNKAHVQLTTTADTGIVAGVIWPSSITAGNQGSMVVWGLAQCDIGAQGVADGGPLCSSATSGGGDMCASTDGSGAYATAAAAGTTGGQINCVVDVR